jgi:hypothetical protein
MNTTYSFYNNSAKKSNHKGANLYVMIHHNFNEMLPPIHNRYREFKVPSEYDDGLMIYCHLLIERDLFASVLHFSIDFF